MRAGLSTIQQTLTPEAASVLNHSIAEAGRRNHGQTTPLHVAATLLASPTGYLRQACIRSHPNSSHPLQCRALELCFSVALERLPTAQNLSPGLEPPISNALMAALKRAQAHQRRGCPEQQQQPLLAVKVELEQLIVSILDDPSVSRVMREASFSSPAVKATIEQSLNTSSGSVNSSSFAAGGLGFRPTPPINRNMYMNPRLQQGNLEQSGQQRREEVKRVVDILSRTKKRNPVLVGDSEPEALIRELLQRIEKREVGDGILRNVQVISLEKEFGADRSQIAGKLKGLEGLIESRMNIGAGSGVILDLGDLKWIVEQPAGFGVSGSGSIPQQIVSENGRTAIVEIGKLLARFGESGGRLSLIGTATCETYLRCQVYHPSMENDWDLQALPIAARSPLPGLFPRLGGNGILSSSVESLTPIKGLPMAGTAFPARRLSENMDPARAAKSCPACMESCERELAQFVGKESEKSTSDAKPEPRQSLPQWMQMARLNNSGLKHIESQKSEDQELIYKQKSEELQRKWNDTCRRLHPSFHQTMSSERPLTTVPSMTSTYNANLLGRQPFQAKLQQTRSPITSLQMSPTPSNPPDRPNTPPGSPVRTDLVLGRPKTLENNLEKTLRERIKDLTGCVPCEVQDKFSNWKNEKHATALDADSFKRIFKGLTEKVGWQPEAASAVATTIIQCKSGNGKRRGVGVKGDSWLLFVGPDKVGKRKMASALSELVCSSNPITIRLGSRTDDDEESDMNFRGKTGLDRIAEAVRRNPFSVVVLEDIDRADVLVHSGIKRAMERGRLPDSHGREIGLGSVIFILTANWLPENLKKTINLLSLSEEKLAEMAAPGWQLNLCATGKTSKRRPDWIHDGDRRTRPRKNSNPNLPFDLNLAADASDEANEGSRNSSDLTFEHEQEHGLINKWSCLSSEDLLDSIDEIIVFKPIDFRPLKSKVAAAIVTEFANIIGEGRSIEVGDEALERIVGGVWFGRTGLEEWVDRVLSPAFQHVKTGFPVDDSIAFRLVPVKSSHAAVSAATNGRDWLPNNIAVIQDGL